MGLFSLLMTVVFAAWGTVANQQLSLLGPSCQQECRAALESLAADFTRSNLTYTGYTGSFGGGNLSVPAVGDGGGGGILFACPESDSAYTLIAASSENLAPGDPNNPGAQQLVLWRRSGVSPETSPGNLSAVTRRVYRTYHSAGLFAVKIAPLGNSIELTLACHYQPTRGQASSANFTLQATRRPPLPRGKCREASRGAGAPQGFSHSGLPPEATGGDGVTRNPLPRGKAVL